MAPITIQQFMEAFDGRARQKIAERKWLVHLGIPRDDAVALFVAPGGGEAGDEWLSKLQVQAGNVAAARSHVGTFRVDVTGLKPGAGYLVRFPHGAEVNAKTAPSRALPAPARFLAYSCFSPWGHGGEVNHGTVHTLHLLKQRAAAADFALALGDQIYVDEGGWLGDLGARALVRGWGAQRLAYGGYPPEPYFEFLYRLQFSIPPFDAALATVPTAMMWDDHDIRDGWGSEDDENTTEHVDWRPHYTAARKFFLGWQMLRNRPFDGAALADDLDLTSRPDQHFTFDWGSTTTVFVMDQRSHRDHTRGRAVSQLQLDAVKTWLDAPSRSGVSTCFVLVSPGPLTVGPPELLQHFAPFRKDDIHDMWTDAGNRAQRDQLLSGLRDHFTAHPEHRLIILSGDLHYGEVRELSNGDGRVIGHEIISSGLAQSGYPAAKGDHALPEVKLLARSLAQVGGPSFAELTIAPGAGGVAPAAHVYFHVGAVSHGMLHALGELLGPTAGAAERVARAKELVLGPAQQPPWGLGAFDAPRSAAPGDRIADDWRDPFER